MPQSKQIFFDPDRKRWRRLRFVIDTSVIIVTLLVVFFVVLDHARVVGARRSRCPKSRSRTTR